MVDLEDLADRLIELHAAGNEEQQLGMLVTVGVVFHAMCRETSDTVLMEALDELVSYCDADVCPPCKASLGGIITTVEAAFTKCGSKEAQIQ